jgi:hypothetical protein
MQWGGLHPPCCVLFPFFNATKRCKPPLCVIFPSMQRGGVRLLGVSSSLFPMHGEVCISSAPSLRPSTHAKHEKTPLLVSFCVRCLFFVLQHMPSMKRHQQVSFRVRCLFFAVPLMPRMKPHHRGCCFVFGTVRVCHNCRDGFLMLVFVFLYFSTVPTVLGR